MIPKVIHYCWFGKGEPPKLMRKCLKSWKKYLPEYKIMIWNEDSFDVESILYTKEAYQARKFAFVSDYVRLYALYEYGGVYMDTDVEILKPLDHFLSHQMFSGFESPQSVPTGLMASEKGNVWIQEQLNYYNGRHFLLPDGKMDLVANVFPMTQSAIAHGLTLNNQYQELENGCVFYPTTYFCPLGGDNILKITHDTYAIHHFSGSWLTQKEQKSRQRVRFFKQIFGHVLTEKLITIYLVLKKKCVK